MMGITSGLNTRGGQLTSELNAFLDLDVVQTVLRVGDWYVREDNSAALQGPFSFQQADSWARWLSNEDQNGKAELVTFLGERGGDPVTVPAKLFVKYMYIYGKRTLGGRTATYHSTRGLPIIVS